MERISGIWSASNMQIINSKLCEACWVYSAVDGHAFPSMWFAVA